MIKKRICCVLSILTAVLLCFSGCGSADGGASTDTTMPSVSSEPTPSADPEPTPNQIMDDVGGAVLTTTVVNTQGRYEMKAEYPDDEMDQGILNDINMLKNTYSWYGISGFFPFTGMDVAGLVVGSKSEETMADTYYSLAIDYDAPDGTQTDEYESNYLQFNSNRLGDYRWYWDYNWYPDIAFSPKQPQAYKDVIWIDVAELNMYCIGGNLSNIPGYEDYSYNEYLELPFVERVKVQDLKFKWEKENSPRYGMSREDQYYYHITGLCILNGDSRTKKSYFAGSRAKNIQITVNGAYTRQVLLEDTPSPQLIDLDYLQNGVDKPVHIEIEVIDSYDGSTGDIYITEIGIGIDSNIPQGI